MIIETFSFDPISTNAYFVANEATGEAFIIDAPLGSYEWTRKLIKKHSSKLMGVLLTHGHWDHILDAHLFAKDKIALMGHSNDRLLFENPELMSSFSIPGLELKGFIINNWLDSIPSIVVAGIKILLFEVPGHCPGSMLFYLASESIAFVGDAIFNNGVGRCDLPGGNFAELENSIKSKVYTLPDETELFPGHGISTSVLQEKNGNPFVRL
mgnify:CR=1 FL=1